MSATVQIIITILGSGTLFSFLQFLITRNDTKESRIDELEEEIQDGLRQREETGKKRYEEHREAIKELNKAILSLTKDAKDRKEFEKYMGASLMAITHDKLVTLGKQYQERGVITLAEKNNLKLLFEPYHNGLGGNSDGETYYNYCMSLPVVTDIIAQEKDLELKRQQKDLIQNMERKTMVEE